MPSPACGRHHGNGGPSVGRRCAGPGPVTYYTVPYQLVAKARCFRGASRAPSSRAFPRDSARGDRLAAASVLSLLVLMTPVILCAALLLHPFMSIWVGKEMAASLHPGRDHADRACANSVAQIPYFLLQGTGRPGVIARLQLIEFGPFILALWAALHWWGLQGAAWTWTMRAVADAIIVFMLSRMPSAHLRAAVVPAVLRGLAVTAVHWIGPGNLIWRSGLAVVLFGSLLVWTWTSKAKASIATLLGIRSVSAAAQSQAG